MSKQTREWEALTLENKRLENELLKAQIEEIKGRAANQMYPGLSKPKGRTLDKPRGKTL